MIWSHLSILLLPHHLPTRTPLRTSRLLDQRRALQALIRREFQLLPRIAIWSASISVMKSEDIDTVVPLLSESIAESANLPLGYVNRESVAIDQERSVMLFEFGNWKTDFEKRKDQNEIEYVDTMCLLGNIFCPLLDWTWSTQFSC